MLLHFLIVLILIIKKSMNAAATNDEIKDELRLIHQEIEFLKVENRNQSLEIALLKGIMASQNKQMDQKIVQEVSNQLKMKNSQMMSSNDHHKNPSPGSVRQKRPYRLVPINALSNKSIKIDNGKISSSNQQDRFYGPPNNCSDLARLGYTLNGFYTVTASRIIDLNNTIKDKPIKLETVYCFFMKPEGTFNPSSTVEKRIIAHFKLGNDDNSNKVGSPPGTGIHFQLFRSAFFKDLVGKPHEQLVSFDAIGLNTGNAFLTRNQDYKGRFIAPKAGVYQFLFTSVMSSIPKNVSSVSVYLILRTGSTAVDDSIMGSVVGRSGTKEEGNSMVIAATLKLKKGDHIFLISQQGFGYKMGFASFSGSLLEE